ncbi:ABC transporter permease/M1 family aminopeptidase [Glaciecola sp. MF2-115]|uniref:ABC transporter permease/M1 family aminopeptidase n=1 Tax=Glaciecola sp. MF2-115 TaxID=3384827 RepID=UPI0039A37922
MFLKMLSFEWRYYTKQPSFIVTCLVFFLLPYLAMTIDQVSIGGGGNTNLNSPYAIAQTMLIFGLFAMFVVVNFVANTASRNDTSMMAEIVCTKPVPPTSYQLGRFFGAFLVSVTVFSMVPLALIIGSLMPWLDQERLGDFSLSYYAAPFLIYSVSTIFVLSTLFYAIALRFRSIMAVYLTALGLFIIYIVSAAIFDEPNQRQILALVDPFGLRTFGEVTSYWTPFDRNTTTVQLSEKVLINRAIWIGIGVASLLAFGRLFSPLKLKSNKQKKSKNTTKMATPTGGLSKAKYQMNSGLQQFIARTKFEVKQVVFSPAFPVLMLFCAFNLIAQFVDPRGFYGASNWPLTQTMVQLIEGAFGLVNIIVITYYSAEVVWRERSVGMGDIIDSMPVANASYWLSKFLAVCLVIVSIFALGMLATISNQLIAGYTNLDLLQYIVSLFYFAASNLILLVVLSFLLQTMSPNKYIGMLLFVGYVFVSIVFNELGIEHNMFQYGQAPLMQYSDMNGYGWTLTTQNWYLLYWSSLAIVLSIVSYGLWHRGPHNGLRSRFKLLPYQLGRGGLTAISICFLVFVASGTIIHYNTKVVNDFTSRDQSLAKQEFYEKEFAQYEDAPVPVVTSINADVAIFPDARRVETITNIEIENRSGKAIEKFLVNHPRFSPVSEVTIEGGSLGGRDVDFDIAWFTFDTPMLPGEKRRGSIRVVREHKGFKDRGEDTTVVQNGTFISNFSLYPSFGVNQEYYINDQHERRKRDLPPPRRAYPLEDSSRYNESFFGPHVALIDFKATLSTSIDQHAIAPGYLKKEWQQDGRRYFEYEMDSPMVNFFNFMSAKLEVKKEIYKGVEIAVYYHHEHFWNVERMIESTKDSLDYFTDAFGPYQHKQLRIIEFPGYRSFAQSFANTVPYSENIGFITDLRDKKEIDPVYYVTAHEVAHQWFGHQLNAANVQGSAVLSESLSQYAALLVMQNKYGEEKIRKFLTFELDSYLRGRANEYLEEMPMLRSENQQYIHYRKGSVVMMALRDRIGEENLNQALKALISEYKFSETKQPTTLDLVRVIKTFAPEDTHAFVDAQFNQISLYDLKIMDTELTQQEGSSYTLDLTLSAKQFEADGKGEEMEQNFDDYVEIVLFSEDPNDFSVDNEILYREKHRLTTGENKLSININTADAYVGVDPFVRFIDRDSRDNVKKL